MLQHLNVPTLLLWVRQDRHHNWKRIKKLVQKSSEVRVEFVKPPEDGVDFSAGCYEELSDLLVQPILNFLAEEKTERKRTEEEDEHEPNIMFDHNLSVEEMNQILQEEKELGSVKLFKHLTERLGLESLYTAQMSLIDPFHSAASTVFNALPLLSPSKLRKNPNILVELGLWENLPQGLQEMQSSPRYFPGRLVIASLDDDGEDTGDEEVVRVAEITEVDEESVTLEADGERGSIVECLPLIKFF